MSGTPHHSAPLWRLIHSSAEKLNVAPESACEIFLLSAAASALNGRTPDESDIRDAARAFRHSLTVALPQGRPVKRLLDAAERFAASAVEEDHIDSLSTLISRFGSARERKARGAFYTPSWLAETVIEKAKEHSRIPFESASFLDPSCGTGVFLHRLIARFGVANVAGIEIDSLAALCANVACVLALCGTGNVERARERAPFVLCADALSLGAEASLGDAVNTPTIPKAEILVGNPPWVTYADIPVGDRERLKELWYQYGLVPGRGYALLLGNSRADLAHLFFYHAVEKFLIVGGVASMVMPLSSFRGSAASAPFRRFRLPTGETLRVLEIHDLSGVKPFRGISARASFVAVRKGEATQFPVPYISWTRTETSISIRGYEADVATPDARALRVYEPRYAAVMERLSGRNAYHIRQGVNTCGANHVFLFPKGTEPSVEKEFVYPLLAGNSIKRWCADAEQSILFPYDSEHHRLPLSPDELKARAPLLHAYFAEHKKILAARKSSVLRSQLEKGLFYALYGTGAYMFAPFKVVWRAYGVAHLHAAIVSIKESRVIVPNQAQHAYIPAQSAEEAAFVCALLNSPFSEYFCRSLGLEHSKNFAQPSIVSMMAIPLYNSNDTFHRTIFRNAQDVRENPADMGRQHALNEMVADLWNIPRRFATELRERLSD